MVQQLISEENMDCELLFLFQLFLQRQLEQMTKKK